MTVMPTVAVPPELGEILDRLKAITVEWSLERRLDEHEAAKLRRRAAVLLHDHYRAHIPYYRKVCARMKVDGAADFETIAQKLLVPDDIFKSYPQRLLDEGDYARMNEWVSSIGTTKVSFDTSSIRDIDAWIERVEAHGVRLVFSSGTSGHVSFVPRDAQTWTSFTELPFLYVASSLGHRGVLPRWKFSVMKQLGKRLRPSQYTSIVRRYGLRSRDGFLFNFSGGNQGVQLAGQEIGKLTRKTHFLYEKKMSAAAVRAIVRGPRSDAERALVADFLDTTVKRKSENYRRMIERLRESVAKGHRVIVFGTPAVLLEACRIMEEQGLRLELPDGSSVSYGGGWKSFSGTRISEPELVALLRRTFGVKASAVFDSYSMTEIHGIMQKCDAGRFHVPPFLEPLIFAEDLTLLEGDDVKGTLGVVDPFALSYPGFLLTGDNVRLLKTPCSCGLPGATVLRVERSPGKDVKGCGGIMARVNA